MYVCGITPYDATHMGHAATYLAFDLVHRVWLDGGHDVHYVQNVTDVDDPLLERAVRDGHDWQELAERETALFREDMTALGILPPRDYVGAVEAIPEIAVAVQRLREAGATYEVDGDTYFSVHSDPRFGGVGRLDDDDDARSWRRSAAATPSGRARSTRWTVCSGRRRGRGSRHGRRATRRRRDGPAGTSSARRSRWSGSARRSTCRAAAATWSSRTTR